MPLVTSGVVGDLKLARSSACSFSTTASVLVPPTSMPRRKVIRAPSKSRSCHEEIPDGLDTNSYRVTRQIAERDVFDIDDADRRGIRACCGGLIARLGFGFVQRLVAAHAHQRKDPVDFTADLTDCRAHGIS